MGDSAVGVGGSEGISLKDTTRHVFAFELLVAEVRNRNSKHRRRTTLRAEVRHDLQPDAATNQLVDVRGQA